MRISTLLPALAIASAITLSACDSAGDNYTSPPPPAPPPPVRLEDQFGTGFGAIYRMTANVDAVDPAADAIIPVDPIRDSIPIP